MFYVYGSLDPHCSCCRWEYYFDEFTDLEEAKKKAVDLDIEGYVVTLISGDEINIVESVKEENTKREKIAKEKEIAKEFLEA